MATAAHKVGRGTCNDDAQARAVGIEVGPLALGGNVFGWTIDEAASFRILDAFGGIPYYSLAAGFLTGTFMVAGENKSYRRKFKPEML